MYQIAKEQEAKVGISQLEDSMTALKKLREEAQVLQKDKGATKD